MSRDNYRYFITFACRKGQALSTEKSFEQDLLDHLGKNLKQDKGKIELNSFLVEVEQYIGCEVFIPTFKS